MHPYLKIAYQPYKWLFVSPMVLILTMLLGLVCIVVGLIFTADAANLIAADTGLSRDWPAAASF